MRCKSSVKVAQLAWFIYASHFSSPSAPTALWCLEWVLMFHDLHCVPFVCGWVLIWNCLLSFYCRIDVPTPHSCTFKMCVCALRRCIFFFFHKHLECMCVWVPFIPWPSIPCQIKYWWKALNDLAPAHWPFKFGFKILFQLCSNQHTMKTGGTLSDILQECNSLYSAPVVC